VSSGLVLCSEIIAHIPYVLCERSGLDVQNKRSDVNWTDLIFFRNAYPGVPSCRPPSPYGIGAYPQNLPYAHLCAQRGSREIPFLVFPEVCSVFSVPRTSGWSSHRQLKKVKKASGEIIGVNLVCILDAPCSPQEAGGTGFADYFPCDLVRVFCGFFHRFTREDPWRSRTLASGSDMTLAQAPITCTRNFARSPELMPWRLFIRTWLPATVPASGLSRWGPLDVLQQIKIDFQIDPQGCWDWEGIWCPSSVHQAASRT